MEIEGCTYWLFTRYLLWKTHHMKDTKPRRRVTEPNTTNTQKRAYERAWPSPHVVESKLTVLHVILAVLPSSQPDVGEESQHRVSQWCLTCQSLLCLELAAGLLACHLLARACLPLGCQGSDANQGECSRYPHQCWSRCSRQPNQLRRLDSLHSVCSSVPNWLNRWCMGYGR